MEVVEDAVPVDLGAAYPPEVGDMEEIGIKEDDATASVGNIEEDDDDEEEDANEPYGSVE